MKELKIVIYLLTAIIYLILGICNFFSSKSISIITLFASFIFLCVSLLQ